MKMTVISITLILKSLGFTILFSIFQYLLLLCLKVTQWKELLMASKGDLNSFPSISHFLLSSTAEASGKRTRQSLILFLIPLATYGDLVNSWQFDR